MRHPEIIPTHDHQAGHPSRRVAAQINLRQGHWGRGCHDAIEVIFNTLRGRNARRLWILDADLTAAFDRIDHSQLVAALGSFPGRGAIGQWLKAGVFEPGKGFTPTEEGTPQGGIISPALLNVALHGLEAAAGVRYQTGPAHIGWVRDTSPILVRYADDFIVACPAVSIR